MPNQMIALQARGPQLPNLGAAAAQYGNMMANMALMKEKQAGIERANAFRQLVSDPGFDPANPEHVKLAQSLDPAGAEKIVSAADARRKAQQDYTLVEVKRLRDIGAAVGDETGYQDWLTRVEKVSPGDAAAFRQFSPHFDPSKMNRIIMTADQYINKTIATPTASFQVSENGAPQSVTVGGLQPSVKEIPQFRYTPDQPAQKPAADGAPMPAAPTTKLSPPPSNGPSAAFRQNFSDFVSAPPETIDAAAEAILKGTPVNDPVLRDLSPKDFQEAQRRASRLVLDKTAFSPGGEDMGVAAVQPLTVENAPQIIQTAIQNGVIDQSHVEQLRQMVGPENDAALAQWMRQNNVRIQPTGAPSMRTAVYRQPAVDYFAPQTDDGMSFGGPANALRQNIGYEPTTTRFKSPMQSPMPGTATVPLPRVRGQAAAEEGGKQGVRVATEPVIVGASEEAKNVAELKKNLPKARGALDLAVKQLDRDLADVDYVLRNPARQMVVGAIEGRLPEFINMFRSHGQDAQNVQSRINKIKAKSVVTHLQEMREASPQGSSLFGQVTEYEDRLVNALAGLDQAQDEPTFDLALQDYRGVIADIRQNLPRVFNETYNAVGGSASVRPLPPGGKAGPTMDDIAYLRRNITKKGVAEGFMRTFGQQAFNEAVGRR